MAWIKPSKKDMAVTFFCSECGLSELPSSIHSDDKTEHDAFFVPTCVEELENAEYVAPLKALLSMTLEDPVDEQLHTCSRPREYVDSKRKLVAKKLCYARPTRSSWPVKQGRIDAFPWGAWPRDAAVDKRK